MNVAGYKSSRGRRGAAGRSGFTLVELLVVVSIIALLISILLPSLRCAREQTKSAVCISNLKGIATASNVYASDDEAESSVPVHHRVLDFLLMPNSRLEIARLGWGGKSGRGEREGNIFFWGTQNQMGPAARPLNRFLYKAGFTDYEKKPGPAAANWKKDQNLDLGMFRCPSDKGYTGINSTDLRDSGWSAYDFYGNSYATALNFIFLPSDSDCEDQPCCSSNSPALRPLSRIPNPSNTLYYEEHAGRNAFWAHPQGLNDNVGPTPYPDSIVHGWHPCRGEAGTGDWIFNVSFVDAHASAVRMKGFENPHLSHYPECPNPNNCYQFWRGIIVRGSGWQKDCLPSPPVLTEVPCNN
ncbi:MAG: prepilin-type N-terminal cleavage/methylation domain-containing protein [bacterium]|nr:prepilin-type N-terminal cleavage/methylation domain-containing protein [bacterium]